MRTKIITALLLGVLATGCSTMEKMGAAMQKMNEENKARLAEEQRKALIESHLAENLPTTFQGKSVRDVAMAVEKVQAAKGYNCHDVKAGNGSDGLGVRVDCDKRQGSDLGSSIATNALTNMLGGDRGKIVRESIDENQTDIRLWWANDGKSKTDKVGITHRGLRYKITQNDQHVEERPYNLSEQAQFEDALRAALK